MKTFLCLILFFFINQDSAKGYLPKHGVRMIVSENGLVFLSNYLENYLQNKTFALSDEVQTTLMSQVSLTKATILDSGKVTVFFDIMEIWGMNIDIVINDIFVRGVYKLSLMGMKREGMVDIIGKDISIFLSVTEDTRMGRPYIEFVYCKAQGHLEIKLDDKLSTLGNVVAKLFKNSIEKNIFDGICHKIAESTESISKAIRQNYPKKLKLNNIFVDIDLSEDIMFYKDGLAIYFDGNVYANEDTNAKEQNIDSQYKQHFPQDLEKSFYLYLTNHTMAQLARACHESGQLNVNLTLENLPDNLFSVLEELPSMVGENPEESIPLINLKTSKIPIVSVDNGLLYLESYWTVTVFLNKTNDFISIGTYNLKFFTIFKATFEHNYLNCQIKSIDADLLTVETISKSYSDMLEKSVRSPLLSSIESMTIPFNFPFSEFISLKDTSLEFSQNSVLISTDMDISDNFFNRMLDILVDAI